MSDNRSIEFVEMEFEDMKERFEKFIEPLKPEVRDIKENVFYHLTSNERTKKDFIRMANETRPFLSNEIWNLLETFMDFMRNVPGEEGNNYRTVYEGFSPADLVKRLLFKRPIYFYGANDRYMMRMDGTTLIKGVNKAIDVAKILDKPNRVLVPYLREYISYDENLLSALIGMSTPTIYVSDGSLTYARFKKSKGNPHIDQGILCGLVGARNKKTNFMENHFLQPRNDKLAKNCHLSDQFWITHVYQAAFPEGKIPSIEEIKENPSIYQDIYIDNINIIYFEKRLMFSIVPYIKEAISRGNESGRNVFCNVAGIGAGVWAGNIAPNSVLSLIVKVVLNFLDNFYDPQGFKCLKAFALPQTNIISYASFKPQGKIANIKIDSNGSFSIVTFKGVQDHSIKIYNETRYIAQLLPNEFKDCLSISSYAWDGNSYPGNEYWDGKMGTFDPKAILCSLLGQFQNPEVNIKMADPERIRTY